MHANELHLGALMEIFYVGLGSSMGLALLVWVGGGLLKRVFYIFGKFRSKISDPVLRNCGQSSLTISNGFFWHLSGLNVLLYRLFIKNSAFFCITIIKIVKKRIC